MILDRRIRDTADQRRPEQVVAGNTGSFIGAWYRLEALVDWERAARTYVPEHRRGDQA